MVFGDSLDYTNNRTKRNADSFGSLNYFAATESVVLLKLAHSLSSICSED